MMLDVAAPARLAPYVSPDGGEGWMPVLKNAHSSVAQALRGLGWEKRGDAEPGVLYAVIRNPVDRYFSTLGMMLKHMPFDALETRVRHTLERSPHLVWTNGGDTHFAEQADFLGDAEVTLVGFPHLASWLAGLGVSAVPHRQKSDADLVQILRKRLEGPELVARLEENYAADFALWRRSWRR